MDLRRDELTRTVRAPAKLNLYLEVLGRAGDGFHELETLMVPVRLWDTLSFSPLPAASPSELGEIRLHLQDRRPGAQALDGEATDAVPTDRTNLVVRALELLRERSGCPLGARVELVKRIPSAAGLGGGSSDAAAALRVSNAAWQLGWTRSRLAELAGEIGSDAPFFLAESSAVCRGRGDRVEPLSGLRPLNVVIVKPPAGLSTADVYREHDRLAAPFGGRLAGAGGARLAALVAALAIGATRRLEGLVTNGLQAAAARLSPRIDEIRAIFAGLDVAAHQLSGSGSAYFGVCRHAQHARRLAAQLRSRRLGLVYATRTCS